jgi:hypothetical protein
VKVACLEQHLHGPDEQPLGHVQSFPPAAPSPPGVIVTAPQPHGMLEARHFGKVMPAKRIGT